MKEEAIGYQDVCRTLFFIVKILNYHIFYSILTFISNQQLHFQVENNLQSKVLAKEPQ